VTTPDLAAYSDLMAALTAITMAAAAAIRRASGQGGVHIKQDGSPVTAADQAAETVIRDGLMRVAPDWPIISEETVERAKPAAGQTYFLVDPLDGTREFIAGLDEYTVNIAVVAGGAPRLGIIAQPARAVIWRGIVGRGAEKLEFSAGTAGTPRAITTRARPQRELVVMVSRSHLDARTQAFVDSLPHKAPVGCGSSVKFCRVAEGAADVYPRLAPTHDWDIAAGHAILVAAGGTVIDPDGKTLRYGTAELLIPAFVAWGGPAPTKPAVETGH